MRKTALFILLAWGWARAAHAAPTTWRQLAPGLGYAKISISAINGGGALHAFRIDPARYRIDTLLARDAGMTTATARALAERTRAWIVVNGGFFGEDLKPLGLRIQGGRERNPMRAVSWWSIFYIHNGRPAIATRGDFPAGQEIQMAVQSGPRLVVSGAIPALKPGPSLRSAIGITHEGEIVLAVTEGALVETRTLAELFRKSTAAGGLNCPNAINLDGGGSTQLYAKVRDFRLDLPGITPVTDVVAVFPR
ncbi:MAG: phosphodiester glycosidase family protein [Deltaproteobacteria bacterium]|nr:phosphodiester glycosidase family protein [Deltaproteobacteria bacterium]